MLEEEEGGGVWLPPEEESSEEEGKDDEKSEEEGDLRFAEVCSSPQAVAKRNKTDIKRHNVFFKQIPP